MTSGNEKAELQRKSKMVVTKGKSKELKQNQNGRVATKESCPATEKKKRYDEKISCTERDCNETKDKAAKERQSYHYREILTAMNSCKKIETL